MKDTILKGSAADGSYITNDLNGSIKSTELASITFYDASGILVTPSEGTIKVTFSPDTVIYRTVENGDFNAVDVYSELRETPYGIGKVTSAKIELTGIVGADHFKAIFFQV